MSIPKNKTLYNRIKNQAKKKFKVWPSAYASSWVVREYKKRGGKYSGSKPNKDTGLRRWFDEKWIDVCKLPKKSPCGRPKMDIKSWKKKYPYCRPSKKISRSTPRIASKLTKSQIRSRCRRKKADPRRRVSSRRRSRKINKFRMSHKSSRRRVSSRRRSRRRVIKNFKWMSYSAAAKYIPEAKKLKVSEVARSKKGFMGVYKRMKTSGKMNTHPASKTLTWGGKRNAFIKRHMAQYKKNPTYRRWLALVMWAYKPPGKIPK